MTPINRHDPPFEISFKGSIEQWQEVTNESAFTFIKMELQTMNQNLADLKSLATSQADVLTKISSETASLLLRLDSMAINDADVAEIKQILQGNLDAATAIDNQVPDAPEGNV